ncbi:DNA binding protein [Dorcoceras hygrometricum]|uniref:DNA binding protein n=1 Tax=Dorcoceras hygrometricum TaxID=472368 RepID=A0A2Z7CZP6_9LAMI|nr:DNA binding protein [Dorcoceras hygrometricum]
MSAITNHGLEDVGGVSGEAPPMIKSSNTCERQRERICADFSNKERRIQTGFICIRKDVSRLDFSSCQDRVLGRYSRAEHEFSGQLLHSPRVIPDLGDEYARTLQSPTPDVPEVLDVVTACRLNYLATSIGAVCGKRRRRYKMPSKRTRAQRSGENSNTESTTQGSENPTLTPAQIAELVATTVAQVLAGQPAPQPPPNLDQQVEEIRRMREELEIGRPRR